MNCLSIRCRMTLWYGAVMIVLITAFTVAAWQVTIRGFSARIDFELTEEATELSQELVEDRSRSDLLAELQDSFAEHDDYEFEVIDSQGVPFFRSKRLAGVPILGLPASQWPDSQRSENREIKPLGEHRVLLMAANFNDGEPTLLVIAIPLRPLRIVERDLLRAVSLVGPGLLIVALFVGYWLAGRLLAPITQIATTADSITVQHLKQRIEVSAADDELTRLARTLNAMIERLDHAFDEMQRFTADAAHELRTPLTVMRTQLDVALRTERTGDAYRDVLRSLRQDVDRMTQLAAQLLELAREDAGLEPLKMIRLNLEQLVSTVVEQLLPVAQSREVAVDLADVAPTEICGDAARLQRVLVNVLDNALKYAPIGSRICVGLRTIDEGRHVQLDVTDFGPGISAEHLPFVFNRFYRADQSRSTTGAGLGMAISKAIISAHHGTIEMLTPSPRKNEFSPSTGIGTTCRITLPANIMNRVHVPA